MENGRASFWQDKQGWLRTSPEFNIDKVQAPFLYLVTAEGPISATERGLAGGFVATRRPFELIRMSQGAHPLVRPRERQYILTLLADWMGYWLKGEVPSEGGAAARWDKMRGGWDRQRAWEAAGNPVGSVPASK